MGFEPLRLVENRQLVDSVLLQILQVHHMLRITHLIAPKGPVSRPLSVSIFQVQDSISEKIAAALSLRLLLTSHRLGLEWARS